MNGRRALLLGLLLPPAMPARAQDPATALRPPVVGLMRHGGGVPPEEGAETPIPGCDLRAVLTEEAEAEMRRFGARLRAEGLSAARIYTSRQCSAWQTAELLGLGPPQPDPTLDPYPPTERRARREALRQRVLAAGGEPVPTLLVTHRTNILDLTGIHIDQGEILLLRTAGGRLTMAGWITPD